jgi:hypothetical protein
MPYITKDMRAPLDAHTITPQTAGELNYLVTRTLLTTHNDEVAIFDLKRIVEDYTSRKGLNYERLNQVGGVLTMAAAEGRRRLNGKMEETDRITDILSSVFDWFYETYAAPYENVKIKENGDVYPQQEAA